MPTLADDVLPSPDPNLCCSICLNVFSHPVRTACGHVFCGACLQSWLAQKAQCPDCRAPVVDAARDRFAERLVAAVLARPNMPGCEHQRNHPLRSLQ